MYIYIYTVYIQCIYTYTQYIYIYIYIHVCLSMHMPLCILTKPQQCISALERNGPRDVRPCLESRASGRKFQDIEISMVYIN